MYMYWTENMWGSDDINIIQNFLSPCGGERKREKEYYGFGPTE